jgi:nucleotide-binding universal stress UspA family protein
MDTRILVALDSSPRAPLVLRAATRLAEMTGARLLLLRAVGLLDHLPVEAFAMSPDDVLKSVEERARRELGEVAVQSKIAPTPEVLVEVGAPWQVICDAARDHDVSVVVIGSHGFSGLDHVLGTTAARVVDHAHRSVLVVRGTGPFG